MICLHETSKSKIWITGDNTTSSEASSAQERDSDTTGKEERESCGGELGRGGWVVGHKLRCLGAISGYYSG